MSAPMDLMLDSVDWEPLPPAEDTGSGLPYATHRGVVRIGEASLLCYVLSDGNRVFDADSVAAFFNGLEAEQAPPVFIDTRDCCHCGGTHEGLGATSKNAAIAVSQMIAHCKKRTRRK